MNGAEIIVRFLENKGVNTLFGYPGASVLELYDAIRDSSVTHVLMRHEQGASHAAAGYAKASGKTGVCIATSGPGAANLVTGIADAYLDSVPMIVITGQVDTGSIGRDAFQEADILGITMPITKHSYLVRHPEDLKRSLWEAWNIAVTDRPGPVLIDIAHDVLLSEFDLSEPDDVVLPRKRKNESPLSDRIESIKNAVSRCHRPLILAGGGVVLGNASESLSRYAAQSGIPIVTTLPGMGISLSPEYRDRINMLGMTGIYGCDAANAAMDQCDLLIAVGCRMSDRTLRDFDAFSQGKSIIHCDIDPAEINKNVSAGIPVVSDAKTFFETLFNADIVPLPQNTDGWNVLLKNLKHKALLTLPDSFLSCREILRTIDTIQKKYADTVFVTDVGNHQMRAAVEIEPSFERGFITSAGLGVMGFGLPASVGASFAGRDNCRQIVLLCGDGGFQMTIEELAVLSSAPLPIKIFLFDNSSLGMIRKIQDKRFGGRHVDSELPSNPDFEMIGKAYRLRTKRLDVDSRDSLPEIIDGILSSDDNMLIHCITG